MIDDLLIKKEKNNFYQINVKEGKDFKNLTVFVKNVFLPFGLEEFNNKFCVNFEVDKQSDYYALIRLLEGKINELIESDEYELKSVFHKKPKFNLLCKAHIKKNKNLFVTKYIADKKEISLFELEKQKKYNLELEISGIWIFRKSAGLYINIKTISTNNNI